MLLMLPTLSTQALLHALQSPQIFLQDAPKEVSELPADDFASAGAVLEVGWQLLLRVLPAVHSLPKINSNLDACSCVSESVSVGSVHRTHSFVSSLVT